MDLVIHLYITVESDFVLFYFIFLWFCFILKIFYFHHMCVSVCGLFSTYGTQKRMLNSLEVGVMNIVSIVSWALHTESEEHQSLLASAPYLQLSSHLLVWDKVLLFIPYWSQAPYAAQPGFGNLFPSSTSWVLEL